ncbi:hypothetical protein [Cloacibacillus evryensis]|uniref:hypothetical protein n=1 Tax=Cloacibacillus evryensis TaxID=508460 RepID=UPI002109B134|nr:hypothetical protein [Cloacibacillus evryensis]MCQ4765298.1 hypothetical protein [Cloacibacillus evryensis]
MSDFFDFGVAFIFEGDTEDIFYRAYLEFLCQKYSCELKKRLAKAAPEIEYEMRLGKRKVLTFFHTVNAVTQMPRSWAWFESFCADRHPDLNWKVFLCYDTDSYKEEITKFREGDWGNLREKLTLCGAQVNDISARADIEDLFLQDIEGVCSFLGVLPLINIHGRNGKAKMKNLFRECGRSYHEGVRAKELVCALDMQKLANCGLLPLKLIEEELFVLAIKNKKTK